LLLILLLLMKRMREGKNSHFLRPAALRVPSYQHVAYSHAHDEGVVLVSQIAVDTRNKQLQQAIWWEAQTQMTIPFLVLLQLSEALLLLE